MEAEAESAVEAEGDRKRREADPQLLVPGVLPYAAPVVPLLKHVCKEETQEYCYPETKVVEDTITTKKCLVRDNNMEQGNKTVDVCMDINEICYLVTVLEPAHFY